MVRLALVELANWTDAPAMKRRTFIASGGGTLLGVSLPKGAEAQAAPRRIGFLTGFNRANVEAFLGELRPELERLG